MMIFRRSNGPEGQRPGVPAIQLNVAITGLALVLAAIAAQSPFF
jgi:hypothetical protein